MSDDRIALWIGFCAVGGFCAYSWYWYIRSFIFYFRNDFDFSKDFGPKFRSEFAKHDQDWVTPREKFLIDWPFWVLCTSFMLLIIVLALVGVLK
ncbi:hypothetical protein EFR84_20800 [Rhizobium chutanense]|uniref:Transmembrane protein n=1 Tax=Rhizobium chutanense TaxID=2035448 RepID=A0A432NSB8_9HYPH|nr:hypothetical protein [Rhizobium chutanense]RUM02560.1 hypothetical protein EFR84_20800 [Rhizobium chutanense]